MKNLFKYFKPYILWLIVLIGFVWGQAHANLTLPDYMSTIVTDGIIKKNMDVVWSNGMAMLAVTLVGGLCAIVVGFIAARVSTSYVRKLREVTFDKVERFSLNEFNSFSSASLATRVTNDMQQIQNVSAMIMRMAFLAPIMGIGSVIKAYQLAPSMSWIILAAIGALSCLIVALFIVVIPKFSVIQKLVDRLSLQIKETLTGARVIRAYNNDENQHKKFNQTNLKSTNLNIFVNRVMALLSPIMMLIMGLSSLAVIWIGAYVIDAGNLHVGDLLALMQYVSQTIMAFLMISMIFVMVPRVAVSFRRVNEILSTEPAIVDADQSISLPKKINGLVEFSGVSFGYEGSEQSVLHNISFTANPGETTAIIGGTGSGKSTLLNLIPRLYDVTGGVISIDGVDIRDISQKELRTHIGYVPQKASLFSGTVKSNILYGSDNRNNQDELGRAIKIAQADEFVSKLDDGVKSPISQFGSNVSGGQRQRLSIARALAKKPEIYLFDDSFSALDFKTDAALRKALNKEVLHATFIVVAQRISTIMQAEKIIVIDEGRIVGEGTHSELLKKSKVYREIAESQLSANELMENE